MASVLDFRGPDDTLLGRRHKSHGPPASESQKKVRESPGLDCDVARDMSIERDALAPRPQHVGSLKNIQPFEPTTLRAPDLPVDDTGSKSFSVLHVTLRRYRT